jgi:hypothetical protein
VSVSPPPPPIRDRLIDDAEAVNALEDLIPNDPRAGTFDAAGTYDTFVMGDDVADDAGESRFEDADDNVLRFAICGERNFPLLPPPLPEASDDCLELTVAHAPAVIDEFVTLLASIVIVDFVAEPVDEVAGFDTAADSNISNVDAVCSG